MQATTVSPLTLTARDISGQRAFKARRVTPDASVAELVRKLVARLGLGQRDAAGETIAYRAFLEREGRHLHGSERVGDSLRTDDRLVVQPDIQAGQGIV